MCLDTPTPKTFISEVDGNTTKGRLYQCLQEKGIKKKRVVNYLLQKGFWRAIVEYFVQRGSRGSRKMQ